LLILLSSQLNIFSINRSHVGQIREGTGSRD
jgi:hypothetical protein